VSRAKRPRPAKLVGALLVGTLLVVSTPGAGAASEAVSASGKLLPPARFSSLRVCAYPAFSLAQKRCTRDQRKATLVSGKFACSVNVRVNRPNRMQAQLTLDGDVVYRFTTRVLAKGSSGWWISENLASTPLPGGRWGCDFSFGSSHAGVRFRSGGPTGKVIGAAVCDPKNSIVYAHHRIRVCRSDESTRPISAMKRILCTAVFVQQTGKKGAVQLLADGKDAARPDVERIPAPLSIAWTPFTPSAPAADGTFPPGDYACRFSVNGVAVVEKPFRIVPR
jgi:hypothetical protein